MATILLVDDESKILKFLTLKLKLSGYDVLSTTSGQEALSLARSHKPDIVLLDIVMPGTDGFQVLRELRTFSQIPVIAFSARHGSAEQAMTLGANDCVEKPFNPDDLITRINSLLLPQG